MISVKVGGRVCRSLVDTGCTRSLIRSSVVHPSKIVDCKEVILSADGKPISVVGKMVAIITIDGKTVTNECVVVNAMIPGVDFILGTDVLQWFEFSLINGKASICATACNDNCGNAITR